MTVRKKREKVNDKRFTYVISKSTPFTITDNSRRHLGYNSVSYNIRKL